MAESSYMMVPGQTQADFDMKRKLAMMLYQQSMEPQQIKHWTQGAAQLLKAGLAGYDLHDLDKQDREETASANEMKIRALYGNGAPQQSAPAPTAPAGNPANAIASIESGGKYDALGPETKGDRAYGKYQVMGANIPSWSKAHFGQELTPDQFLANPQAQDAVFKGQFGQYQNKYGPEGAARAWFAGEGGMNNPNAKDVLGTTVQGYGQKFAQALGQPAAPAAPAASGMPGMPDKAAMIEMLRNRKSAPLADQIIQQQIGQRFKPREYKIEITPDGRVIAADTKDPTKIQVNPVPGGDKAAVKHAADKEAATTAAKLTATRQTEEGMPASGEITSKLRNEIQGLPSYKNVAQAAPVYKSMTEAAGRDNRAADVNLIYGMAKIMDPGSVVRESEMTVAQAIATLPQQLQAALKSQMTGEGRLTPELRQAIMAEARSRIMAYQGMFDQDMSMYKGIAQRGRMTEADVIPSFGPFDEYKAAAPAAAAAAAPPPAMPGRSEIEAELRRRGKL